MDEGRDGEAETCLKKALESDPNCADAVNKLGALAAKQGRYGEAQDRFTKALELDPNCTEARNSLAWLLATCKDASFRDGKRALELALKAAEQAGSAWYTLDTLAAAYAADGQFELAVKTQEKAITALKPAAGPAGLAVQKNINDMERRLDVYKKGTAYIDEGPTPPP